MSYLLHIEHFWWLINGSNLTLINKVKFFSPDGRDIHTYLWGTVNLGAVICEVVVGLLSAYGLQLLRWKEKFCKTQKNNNKQTVGHIVLQFALLLPHSHHVIPQGNGHLSMSSLTDVETVHREETPVSFTHLVERLDF